MNKAIYNMIPNTFIDKFNNLSIKAENLDMNRCLAILLFIIQ
jgi:hypothetical protein